MKYTIETNLYGLKENNLIECLDTFVELIGDVKIKFSKAENVKDFRTLLALFFISPRTTYYVSNGRKQCANGKRRSLIDFYMLQQYYLGEPLTMLECYNIYFNEIPRIGTSMEEYANRNFNYAITRISAIERAKAYLESTFTYYYCTTVKRNVFRSNMDVTVAVLDKIENYKLKENEKPVEIQAD